MPLSTFVSYVYYEKRTARHQENLKFFLHQGVQRFAAHPEARVVLSLNGPCEVPLPPETETFRVQSRKNVGFDFGGHTEALERLLAEHKVTRFSELPIRTYVFLNVSQRGPFLPTYWSDEHHWSEVFAGPLRTAGIVGSSMFFHNNTHEPVVESWAFALRPDALDTVWGSEAGIFIQHPHKSSAQAAEENLTRRLVAANLGYASLLLKFQQKEQTYTNNYRIPSRPFDYEGINIHPLEVVFYKTYWDSAYPEENHYECPVEARYTQWLLNEPENSRAVAMPRPPELPAPPAATPFPWALATVGGIAGLLLVVVVVLSVLLARK